MSKVTIYMYYNLTQTLNQLLQQTHSERNKEEYWKKEFKIYFNQTSWSLRL